MSKALSRCVSCAETHRKEKSWLLERAALCPSQERTSGFHWWPLLRGQAGASRALGRGGSTCVVGYLPVEKVERSGAQYVSLEIRLFLGIWEATNYLSVYIIGIKPSECDAQTRRSPTPTARNNTFVCIRIEVRLNAIVPGKWRCGCRAGAAALW